jgi:hypothetical protein
MSERHSGMKDFDNVRKHDFSESCTTGSPLNEEVMAAFGIQRTRSQEGIQTTYPSGFKVDRYNEGNFGLSFSTKLKYRETKDGLSILSDQKGHSAAYLSADGNFLMFANGKVLQENKDGVVSVNDIACYEKEPAKKPETMRQVYVLPEIKITVDMKDAQKSDLPAKDAGEKNKKEGKAEKGHRADRPHKSDKVDKQKKEEKPFNWDSDDPLEGIDIRDF